MRIALISLCFTLKLLGFISYPFVSSWFPGLEMDCGINYYSLMHSAGFSPSFVYASGSDDPTRPCSSPHHADCEKEVCTNQRNGRMHPFVLCLPCHRIDFRISFQRLHWTDSLILPLSIGTVEGKPLLPSTPCLSVFVLPQSALPLPLLLQVCALPELGVGSIPTAPSPSRMPNPQFLMQ